VVFLNDRASRLFISILLLLAILNTSLVCTAYARGGGTLSVTVRNEWMSHLENSSVYLDGAYQGMTDRFGHLAIENFSAGHHNVTVEREGYASSSIEKDFNSTEAIEFKLKAVKPENSVTIVVLDDRASRSAILGAKVYVDDQFMGVTKGGDGSLTLQLEPGNHTIKVTKDQLHDNLSTINVVPGSTYTILMSGGGKKFNILDADLFIYSIWKEITYGLVNTLKLSIIAYALGLCIGLVMGIGRTSSNSIFRGISSVYVEGIRGLPLLLQLLFVNFGFPFMISDLMGQQFNIDAFTSCIIALSVNSGAYMGEIFKAGIEAVSKGQTEAARSLGMTHAQSMRYIILPQAFKIVLPALGNEFIALIKDSSIALVLAVTELTMEAKLIGVEYYNTFTPLLAAGIIYLSITIPLGRIVQYIEKKYNVQNTRTAAKAKKKVKPLTEEFI
jgi:polar amino acid transport system permease protein